MRVTVTLPLPPSANHRLGHARNGRPYLTEETKAWRQEAGWMLHLAHVPIYEQDTKVIVEAWISWPDNRNRDADNLWKEIQDLIQEAGIVKNDRQLIPRVMDWNVDKKESREHRLKLVIYAGSKIPVDFELSGNRPNIKKYKGLTIKSEIGPKTWINKEK